MLPTVTLKAPSHRRDRTLYPVVVMVPDGFSGQIVFQITRGDMVRKDVKITTKTEMVPG